MELTIDEALKNGVEAHRAAQTDEAFGFYEKVLLSQPEHPDANHNMGVLFLTAGKTIDALPFFKTALEANPRVGQYWLSYIDTFIKLGMVNEAQVVLSQANKIGAKVEGFDKLEATINELKSNEPGSSLVPDNPSQSEVNILDISKLNLGLWAPDIKFAQVTSLAQRKATEALVEEAKSVCDDILIQFPHNKKVKDFLSTLSSR
ncbi:MAG: tetratricopeptide repeat protein [Paracoccaceae bacterium]